MAKVIYKHGKKETYLGLTERLDTALYFCTDSKELFKGNDLYTDGLRVVDTFASMPEFTVAADGKLYFCEDTGNGYVLNAARDGWIPVFYGIDGDTIGLNESGLLAVKKVPVGAVAGLEERLVAVETSVVSAVDRVAVVEERLQAVETAQVGGIHYKGSVDTIEDLPVDAVQGDLYEVLADNSEWCWNGEKWFEYGSTTGLKPIAKAEVNSEQFSIDNGILNLKKVDSGIVSYKGNSMDETMPAVFVERDYEIVGNTFDSTLVNYRDHEIRVMFAEGSPFAAQDVGEGGNPDNFYVGFRAYAPDAAVGFKEDLAKTINDQTLYSFEGNPTAGTDKFGRKYSVVWLPVAVKNGDSWSYFGATSTDGKMIGWYYSVEWYNDAGVVIGSDCIRINLTNEACHNSNTPYFMSSYPTVTEIEEVVEAVTWQAI